jgi:cell division protease FtsH
MSKAIGPIAVLPSETANFLLPGVQETSAATQELVDSEVRRIVESAHHDVMELLQTNRKNLDDLVDALLTAETLDEADAYKAAGLTRDSAKPVDISVLEGEASTDDPDADDEPALSGVDS